MDDFRTKCKVSFSFLLSQICSSTEYSDCHRWLWYLTQHNRTGGTVECVCYHIMWQLSSKDTQGGNTAEVLYSPWAVLAHIVVRVFRFGTVGHGTTDLVGIVPNNLKMRNQKIRSPCICLTHWAHVNLSWDMQWRHTHQVPEHLLTGAYLRVVSYYCVIDGSLFIVPVLHLVIPVLDNTAPADLSTAPVDVLSTAWSYKIKDERMKSTLWSVRLQKGAELNRWVCALYFKR